MRTIKGYERYFVTEDGFVFSVFSRWGRRASPRKLALRLDGNGYPQVVLYSHTGEKRNLKVHRLVAEAYLENPENYPEVNHKDEDKCNNSLSNLEWCDSQYNNEQNKSKWYSFTNPGGGVVKVFNLMKFCRNHELTYANMLKVHTGERKHHKGWRRG